MANTKPKPTMIKKSDINRTFFVPMKRMHAVVDYLKKNKKDFRTKKKYCEINLYVLQKIRHNTFHYSLFAKQNWVIMFSLACRKALYSHDWDKLLYLLQKVPKWKFNLTDNNRVVVNAIYTRNLILLLMYHPSAQAQGLLNEYLHMALGCRSDQDKKAILKILLDLPRKLPAPFKLKKPDGADDSD